MRDKDGRKKTKWSIDEESFQKHDDRFLSHDGIMVHLVVASVLGAGHKQQAPVDWTFFLRGKVFQFISNFSRTHKNRNFLNFICIYLIFEYYIQLEFNFRILGVPDSRLSTRTLHHPFLTSYRSIPSDCLHSNIYSPSHLDIWIQNHSIVTIHRSSTIRMIYNFQTFYYCVPEFYHWKVEFWNSLLSRW